MDYYDSIFNREKLAYYKYLSNNNKNELDN